MTCDISEQEMFPGAGVAEVMPSVTSHQKLSARIMRHYEWKTTYCFDHTSFPKKFSHIQQNSKTILHYSDFSYDRHITAWLNEKFIQGRADYRIIKMIKLMSSQLFVWRHGGYRLNLAHNPVYCVYSASLCDNISGSVQMRHSRVQSHSLQSQFPSL